MAAERLASTILAGTALRTINPPVGLPLVGYPNGRPNRGVGKDLCARAIMIGTVAAATPSAGVVVLDTLGVRPEIVARIREAAAEAIPGLDGKSIMVVATHTHSAPTLSVQQFGDKESAATEAYAEQVVVAAAEALKAAWAVRAESSVSVGRTEVRLGHNRRVVDTAGVATNVWLDLEGLHRGFFNPNVRMLSFADPASRKIRAIVSFYACHPVTLGPGNDKASADYPGYFAAAIEKAIPGCMAVHITGAAGQINPRNALLDDPSGAAEAGEILAKAMLEELGRARQIAVLPLVVQQQTLALPLGPDARGNYSRRADDSIDGKILTTELQVLRLGEVAIISAPGELFGELGLAIENSSPFATTMIAGYANDNLGYLCTDTARREGGYEPMNEISSETEVRLLDAAHLALVAAKKSK